MNVIIRSLLPGNAARAPFTSLSFREESNCATHEQNDETLKRNQCALVMVFITADYTAPPFLSLCKAASSREVRETRSSDLIHRRWTCPNPRYATGHRAHSGTIHRRSSIMRNISRSYLPRSAGCVLRRKRNRSRAQDAAAKKTKTPSEAVLEAWNDVGSRLITMAEDWPEDKYTYKLTPDVRTFQQVLLHVAGSNYDFLTTSPARSWVKRQTIQRSPVTKPKPRRSRT